jgi:3-methyladenine DNA glycosylase AlkD
MGQESLGFFHGISSISDICPIAGDSEMIPAQKELRKFASAENKKINEWFFKTGPGQYGFGDQFIGVKIPENRKVAKMFPDLGFPELKMLLQSPIHEDRILALMILRPRFEKARKTFDEKSQEQIFRFYMKFRHRVNNWDLVDLSAPYLSGPYMYDHSSAKREILSLSGSKSMWDRRIAILSTFYFIRQSRFAETLALSRKYLKDSEDLMHKATGWMLREVGKRDLSVLREFLDQHATKMPRTMLRYAIEKFPERERKGYLQRK